MLRFRFPARPSDARLRGRAAVTLRIASLLLAVVVAAPAHVQKIFSVTQLDRLLTFVQTP